MGKRRYISFKVDDDDEFAAILRPFRAAREPWRVRCGRCMRFTGFCLVCTGTLFQALAPWMLSVIEIASLVLQLLVLAHQPPDFRALSFDSSLSDVVLLGALRAAAISATYAYGSRSNRLRPYLLTCYIVGVLGFAYALVKAYWFKYPPAWIPPASLMTTFAFFSCVHILAARHTVSWARRRGQLGLAPLEALGTLRYSSSGGLPPIPAGSSAAAAAASVTTGPATLVIDRQSDSTSCLAGKGDVDSRFVHILGLRLHYGTANPQQQQQQQRPGDISPAQGSSSSRPSSPKVAAACGGSQQGIAAAWINPAAAAATAAISSSSGIDAVLLVHGSGGDSSSWRLVMAPLATALGVEVIALDRPGSGRSIETCPVSNVSSSSSRQRRANGVHQGLQEPLLDASQQQQQQPGSARNADAYTIESQAQLVLGLCEHLGLKRVVVVGHGDGCLVAIHATAAAAPALQRVGSSVSTVDRLPGSNNSSTATAVVAGALTPGRCMQQQLEQAGADDAAAEQPDSVSITIAADSAATQYQQQQQSSQEHNAAGATQSQPGQAVLQRPDSSSTVLLPQQHQHSHNSSNALVQTPMQQQQVDSTQSSSSDRAHTSAAGSSSSRGAVCICGLVLCAPLLSGTGRLHPLMRLLGGRNSGRPGLQSLFRPQDWGTAVLGSSEATASNNSSQQMEQQLQVISDMPVLIISGEADRVAHASELIPLQKLLQNCLSVVIPRCGHLMYEEAPLQLVQLIQDFFSGLLLGSPSDDV